MMADAERFQGTLLAAACGDALGYPIENLTVRRIAMQYGPFGLRTMVRKEKNKRRALVSDDTQMMLATADGILWSDAKELTLSEGIYRGYMRWFYCQTGEEPRKGQRTWMRRQPHEKEFCLIREIFMHTHRQPDDVSLAALSNEQKGSLTNKINDSKDRGTVVRAVPIGLFHAGDGDTAFTEGMKSGAITHSSPTAYYAAGAAAALIAWLAAGVSLPKSLDRVMNLLNHADGAEETIGTLNAAIEDANNQPAGSGRPWQHLDCIRAIGTGKTADQALSIGVYCALVSDDPTEAIIAAANHSGQSDTTAAMCGAIEGARFGMKFLPSSWIEGLEGKEMILAMADKLHKTYKKNNSLLQVS